MAGLLALVAMTVSAAERDGGSERRIGDIAFEDCELSAFGQSRQAECARLSVPENPDRPDGRQLRLFIARLAANSPEPDANPVLALSGGPGQAASESFLMLDRALDDLARRHDIYLIDQRGTGRSARRDCPLDDRETLLLEPDSQQLSDAARACLDDFEGDPRQFTTSVAVHDFEQARQALGVDSWNLYGLSYGSRVAQHYMRAFPAAVRSAVLDGVLPNEVALGPDIALNSQAALDTLTERCARDADCARHFPDLGAGLDGLLADLADAPRRVEYEDVKEGRQRELTLTRAHLAGLLRLSLYATEQTATLPPLLHQAYAEEHYGPLARSAAALLEDTAGLIAMGMHNAVVCTEDVPFYRIDAGQRSAIASTYLGDTLLKSLEAVCRHWPQGVIDPGFKEPLQSSIPTLLLSGEHDPITPPAYAETAARGLANSRHLVAPGQGHGVAVRGCMPVLIARFIEAGDTDGLDGSCLERLSAAPLFINPNGPAP